MNYLVKLLFLYYDVVSERVRKLQPWLLDYKNFHKKESTNKLKDGRISEEDPPDSWNH